MARGKGNGTPVVIHTDKATAEAAKPTEGKKRLFSVLHNGTARWLWANSNDYAVAAVAKADGYTVSGANGKEISVDAAVARLSTLTDAELKALGLTRKK